MVYTKVFVGNLSFKTKGQDLAGEFSAVGKVLDANIITRGNRSLGYGFVDMDTEENAQKAVSVMNKKNVDGRDINVELARPRDEEKIAERKLKQQQNRPPRPYYKRKDNYNKEEGDEQTKDVKKNDAPAAAASSEETPASPAVKQKKKSRRGKPKKKDSSSPATKEGDVPAAEKDVAAEKEVDNASPAPKRKQKQPRQPKKVEKKEENKDEKDNNNEERKERRARNNTDGEAQERRGPFYRRRRRQNNRLEGGTPSTNSLFVANLPFAVDNEGLEQAFSQFNVKSAKVIMNKNGRSKGFGFVEVSSEKDQQAALEALHEKPLQGRNIAVKVAIIPKPREENEKAQVENSADHKAEQPPKEQPAKEQTKEKPKEQQKPATEEVSSK